MILTPELIAHAKKEVQIEQYLEPQDEVTAQHILFDDFVLKTKWKGLPKIIFYFLLNEIYKPPVLKDPKGYLGYPLKVKEQAEELQTNTK